MVIMLQSACYAYSSSLLLDDTRIIKKDVIDMVVGNFVNDGFTVGSANDYQVTFEKPVTNFLTRALYATPAYPTPYYRVIVNFAPTNGGLKLVLNAQIVSNPNSGHEKIADDTSISYDNYINSLSDYFSRYVGVGMNLFLEKDGDYIKAGTITKGGSADKNGVKTGDLIVSVNDISCKTMDVLTLNKMFKDAKQGDKFKLLLKNGEENREVTIEVDDVPSPYVLSKIK